jgi:uncharacterized protein DUF6603
VNVRELLTLLTEVTVDSLVILKQIFASPDRARAYADAFELPPVQPSTEWFSRVDAAAGRLEAKQYAQALADALELTDGLVTFIRDARSGQDDIGVVDILRRMFVPVVLFCLRQDRDKEDDSKMQYGIQLALTILIFLDDRAQEWYVSPSADERWYQLAADIWGKLDYGDPAGAPFAITDAFFVTTMVAGLLFRGAIQRRVALDEDLFAFYYGFEHPEDPERTKALGALRRSATLAIEDLTDQKFLEEDDYQTFPPEPPTRKPGLATLTLSPMAGEDGSGGALMLRAAGAADFEGPLGGSGWKFRLIAGGGANFVIPFGESPIGDVGPGPEAVTTFEVYYDDEPSTLVPPTEPIDFHAARLRFGVGAEYDGARGILKGWARVERGRVSVGRLPVLELLAPEGFGFDVDLGLIWTSRDGLRIEGGGKSELLLPIDKLLGAGGIGLRLRELRLRWESGQAGDHKTFRVALTFTIGAEFKTVFRFAFEGVGAAVLFSFARNQPRRFASLYDMDGETVAPAGISLSLNWKNKLVGSGFVRREPQGERWVGAAELSLVGKWAIQGLLIRNLTPSGKESWLVIASLVLPGGNPGITIRGISAIVATHRTSDPDAFLAGLRAGDLDALLFPEDPVGRAAQYAAALDRLLPLRDGSEVVGIAVKASALSDRLTVELGLLYDSGGEEAAGRIYVVGQLDLVLPKKDLVVTRIHADFVAVYDRERDELTVLAELRDSRLFGGELTGNLLFFRGDPDLEDARDEAISLLAIGGFHPSYQLPGPRVTALAPKRIRMLVEHGDRIRIDGQMYLAVTPTSLQLGLSIELRARFAGFGVRARLALDVLFHSLVRWEITLQASVEILLGSRTLAGVSLKGVLSGLMPTQLVGTVSISFLFWSFSKSFTATLTVSAGAPDEARPDPGERVVAALSDPEAWDGGGAPGLALREAERPGVWLSPSAPLRVRQEVAPLDVPIDRFGAADLPAPLVLHVDRVWSGPRELAHDPVKAEFAPAVYQNLSEEEKLSGAGFAEYPAGFSVTRAFDMGGPIAGDTSYEEITLDTRQPPRRRRITEVSPLLSGAARALDDAARGVPAGSGKRPIRVREERFAVVDAALTAIAGGLDAASARALARGRRRALVVVEAAR